MNRPQTSPHQHRLPRWQRIAFYASSIALLLTGGVWLAVHYSVGAGAGELPHPLESWSLRVHGFAAFAGLFMFGALAAAHVPQGWRLARRYQWPRQRNTGTWLCAMGALLALSGYLLYYFAPEALRPTLGWVHGLIGLAMAALVVVHRRGVHTRD